MSALSVGVIVRPPTKRDREAWMVNRGNEIRRGKLDEYIDHENRLGAWHVEEERNIRRLEAQCTRDLQYCKDAMKRVDAVEAKAKKRARDSTVVESGIVKKLVKRCTCCKLCQGCEFMHEQYRRSKYGSDKI